MVVLAFAGIQLIPDGTLFVHIFMILLMIWFLNRTFFRPIYKVLETRDKNSGGRSTEAREILAQVQQKESSFDLAMRETRAEGYSLIEKNRSKAVAKRQKNVEAVKQEVETMLATEKTAIAEQTAEAQNTITAEARKMAETISANILKA
jgi:F0F1-type ATP synthase membrane subunit b/b'